MRELTFEECQEVSGAAVDWNRVLNDGQGDAMKGAIAGAGGGFVGGMMVGGVGAGPGAVLGGVGGAVGGFIGGAGWSLWQQLSPHAVLF